MSARKFELYDYESDKYFPLYDLENWGLLLNPKGLEASFDVDYLKNNEYTIVNKLSNRVQEFGCIIAFRSYAMYQKYLFFINSQSLELRYTMPTVNKTFRQRVKVVSTSKTEINAIGTLETENMLLAETPWFVSTGATAGIGRVLDRVVEYKSTYGQYGEPSYRLANRCYVSGLVGYGTGTDEIQTTFIYFIKNITLNQVNRPIPFRVEVQGPCKKPSWSLLKNAVPYITAEFNIELSANERLIVDSLPTDQKAIVYNFVTNTYTNVFLKQTISENYEAYMKMFQGENVLTFKFEDDILPPIAPNVVVYETSILV